MNPILIATGAIIFLGFIIGLYRGAIRIAVSLVTTALTIVLATFAAPYVAQAICNLTPLDDVLEDQVYSVMANVVGTQAGDASEGLSAEGVRKVLDAAGVSEEKLAEYGISIDDIVNGSITGDQLAQYGISSSILDGLQDSGKTEQSSILDMEIPRDVQVAAIEGADLPDIFKNLLSTNNNSEIYEELGAETFGQYVAGFLTRLIINIFAYLCTFLIVTIILRAIIFALDIVSELPGIGFINRLGGGAAGLICGLVVVWILYLVITLLYVTEIGRGLYDMIQENAILKMIYDFNPIMRLAARI